MTDRTIVITGASDGIGEAAARRLHASGERVVLVGRSADKTNRVADSLGAPRYLADFARLDDVRQLAARLRADHPRIDVLANNAGGTFGRRLVSEDGIEMTLQVNHLAPFLLTNLLMDTLLASRASVIQTSSSAAWAGRLRLGNLEHARRYVGFRAYGDAKLANVVFTAELHRRFADAGLASAAFHPGVVRSNFGSGAGPAIQLMYNTPIAKLVMISPDEGADTLVWLAERQPGADWESGRFYTRRRPAATNPRGYDETLGRELWNRSCQYVGLPFG